MNIAFLKTPKTPIGTDEYVQEGLSKKPTDLKDKINKIASMQFKMEAFSSKSLLDPMQSCTLTEISATGATEELSGRIRPGSTDRV